MTVADPRVRPLVALDAARLRAMVAPALGGDEVREVAPAEGGLVNTTFRVTTARGDAYALRVYAAGRAALRRERRLLARLAPALPVPEVLLADASGRRCPRPYLVYRWIEGVTLNECRRAEPNAMPGLAEPLGGLLARIAAAGAPERSRPVRIEARLARADAQLRAGVARTRMGAALADRLRERLTSEAPRLCALEDSASLAHGDLGGRNLIVRPARGGWEIGGVLDWEGAFAGSALWDVGSLFRYPRRYAPEFRERFARGYRAAGGTLPDDWWRLARLLDSTRQVATMATRRELPSVFAECRELLEVVTCDR